MWCSHCQSDVRPVISLAGNPPRCSVCGHEFAGTPAASRTSGEAPPSPPPLDSSRPRLSPHDLLARWAREETLPPFELGAGQSASPTHPGLSQPIPPPPALAKGPAVARLDASHPTGPQPVSLSEQIAAAPSTPPVAAPHFPVVPQAVFPSAASPSSAAAPSTGAPTPSQRPVQPPQMGIPSRDPDVRTGPSAAGPTEPVNAERVGPVEFSEVPHRHWHGPHAAVRPPHFPWEPVLPPPRASSPWRAAAQVFVLAGVVGLTVGTLMLIYTHFWAAETDSLLPLGYVIAACSQLVLLLGVVQHISLGLEQAEQTISWRVAALGERLERVEAAAGQGNPDERRSGE